MYEAYAATIRDHVHGKRTRGLTNFTSGVVRFVHKERRFVLKSDLFTANAKWFTHVEMARQMRKKQVYVIHPVVFCVRDAALKISEFRVKSIQSGIEFSKIHSD